MIVSSTVEATCQARHVMHQPPVLTDDILIIIIKLCIFLTLYSLLEMMVKNIIKYCKLWRFGRKLLANNIDA